MMASMIVWALALSACGGSAEPPRSSPVPPTADLTPSPTEELQTTTLEGFLPPTPGLPVPLQGLFPGQPLEQAAERLGAAAVNGVPPRAKRLGGRIVYSTPLGGFSTAVATLVATEDGQRVESVQINLPSGEGESILVGTWGPADGIVFGDGSDSQYVWTTDQLLFQWKTTPGEPLGLLLVERRSP
jgi:hypothetical protein